MQQAKVGLVGLEHGSGLVGGVVERFRALLWPKSLFLLVVVVPTPLTPSSAVLYKVSFGKVSVGVSWLRDWTPGAPFGWKRL
jgi:hypothetical protein